VAGVVMIENGRREFDIALAVPSAARRRFAIGETVRKIRR